MIELKNVYKSYKTKNNEVQVLKDINIKLPSKGLIFILGKSGSGKTTLLNLIGGLDNVTSGNIYLNKNDITKFDSNMLDNYRNSLVGFIFQDYNLLDNLSVYENIKLPLSLQKKKDNNSLISKVLTGVGLPNMEDRNINELSGGEKQRVSIARAMIKNPDIILADEPTGNLDTNNASHIFNILKQISLAKLVVVVTHDRDSAYKYGDQIIELSDGVVTNIVTNNQVDSLDKELIIRKSKLSLSKSLNFAFSNLKKKKIRLTVSILLVTISLFLFGYTSFLTNYDINKMHAKAINNETITIRKKVNNATDINPIINLNDTDIKYINGLINSDTTNVSRLNVNNEYFNLYLENENENYYYSHTYANTILSFIEYSNDKLKTLKLIGNVPSKSDEIIINKFLADYIITGGIDIYDYDKDNKLTTIKYQPKDYNDIIKDKKKIIINTNGQGIYTFTISGILDEDISKYDILKSINENEAKTEHKKLYDEFNSKIDSLLDIIVDKDLIKEYNIDKNKVLDYSLYTLIYNYNDKKYYPTLGYMSELTKDVKIYDGKTFTKINNLKEDEIILSIETISDLNGTDTFFSNEYKKYLDSNNANNKPLSETQDDFHKYYIDKYGIIGKEITIDLIDTLTNEKITKTYKVVGYSYKNDNYDDIYSVVNSNNISKYMRSNHEVNKIYFSLNDSEKIEYIFNNIDRDRYKISTIYSSTINDITKTISKTKKLFEYLSIGFLSFSIILLTNYIIVTINNNKKQIGILRSLGTKQTDLFKIYYLESIIIVFISYIISSIILYFSVNISNNIISKDIFFNIKPIVFNINTLLYTFILILLISFVTSVLPIIILSKKKPVDVIYERS